MKGINQENWLGSISHHLQQLIKGGLVSLFTMAGYGVAKRWLGESHDAPITDSQEQALTIFSQKIPTDVPTTITPSHASSDLPQQSFTVTNSNSRSFRDIPKPSEKSVAEELGISFPEKEAVTKEPQEKITQPTLTYTTNPENSNAENITIIVEEPFSITTPGYTVGADGKTYFFGAMNATLVDGSPLPPWMHLEPPSKPYQFDIIGTIRTGTARGMAVQRDLALVGADFNGLQLVNISDPRYPKIISNLAFLSVHGVAVNGNIALVIDYKNLMLINITDSRHPIIISSQVLPDSAMSVTVQENVVFVTDMSGLQLVNISDPRHPEILGRQAFPGPAGSVAVRGNVALVAAPLESFRAAVLQLVNVSDTRHPMIISSISSNVINVAVQQDVALVAIRPADLQLVNISDPRHPKLIGMQTFPGDYLMRVTVHGDWALVTVASGNIQIVNIMQPSAPQLVGEIKAGSNVYQVVVQNNLAFLICQNSFKIIDLKTWAWALKGTAPVTERGLSSTVLIRARSLPDVSYQKKLGLYSSSRPFIDKPILGLSVRPGQVLSSRFTHDFLDAIDGILPFVNVRFNQVGDHELPSWLTINYEPVIGSLALGNAQGVTVQGDVALVAGLGLQLVNISDPSHPELIGIQDLPHETSDVTVQGNLALTVAYPGIQLVNISDPRHPMTISDLALGGVKNVAVHRDLALLATGFLTGLQLVNISDPRHPRLIGKQALTGDAYRVIVHENVAFVATTYGLELLDISDLQKPKLIGKQALSGANDVSVQGNLALVVSDYNRLHIVNITDLRHPKLISSQVLRSVRRVAAQAAMALVIGDDGLQLVNIHHPQRPMIMDNIEILSVAWGVTTRDNIVIVATYTGLNIIQYGLRGAVLRGTPSKADHKNYQIVINATNSDGIVGSTTFRISVNNPPLWKTMIAEKIVNVGQVVSFQLPKSVFWDEDGDTLTFSSMLSNGFPLPDWITFFVEGQIYTIIPSSSNRGRHNISVTVNDGYYGEANAWFSLIIPTRKPVKISDIPSQNAFIWRPFELLVSSIFTSPDGDLLSYHAQLKGARPLPQWLHFDNTTCLTSCHFFGNPGITDLTDLEVELVATGLGGDVSAEFSIAIRTNTLFQDLATYYSVSGAGIVVLSLLARFWRSQKMRKINSALNISEDIEGADIKDSQVTNQALVTHLQSLLDTVERQLTLQLKQHVQHYIQIALAYAKQQQDRVVEIRNPWEVIKKIGEEIKRRVLQRFNYQGTFVWVETLHQLLMLIIETEFRHGHSVMKVDKEYIIDLLAKVEKYIEFGKEHGIQIKHQLQLCREALVSMDDTDSIKDNLCCRDSEMLLETIKTMIAPPYGMVRLMYQYENIPSGWYPMIIQMCRLAEQALTNNEKLSELQTTLSQQKDWRVVYEGVTLLGKIARETQDEKIQKQSIEGIQGQTRGLNYYQNYRGFWGRCSPCCDRQSAWIRVRAQQELSDLDQEDQTEDVSVSMRSPSSLRQSLLINSSV